MWNCMSKTQNEIYSDSLKVKGARQILPKNCMISSAINLYV